MRIKRFVYLTGIIFLLFGIADVGAAPLLQATATPSPTPTRDFRTPPTPRIDSTPEIQNLNFSCPPGTPEGYGIVDPDPFWLSSCGQCLPTPTAFPTFNWNVLNPEISCGNGYMSCVQVNDQQIMLYSDGLIPLDGGHNFIVGEGQDIRIDYYLRGYSLFELSTGSRFSAGNLVLGPGGSPTYHYSILGDYDYSWEGYVEAGEYQAQFRSEGISPGYYHDLACSKIYVSVDSFPSSFPDSGCPLRTECEYSPVSDSYSELNRIEYYNAGSGTVSDTESCFPWYNGFRCTGFISVQAAPDVHRHRIKTFIFNTLPDIPYSYYWANLNWSGSGTILNASFAVPGPNDSCGGLFKTEGNGIFTCSFPNNYFGPESIAINLRTIEGGFVALEYDFIVQPEEPYPLDCDGFIFDPLGDGGNLNYCSSVVPIIEDPLLDMDILKRGDSMCSTIPYFSASDFVPEWLQAILSGSAIWDLILDAHFPASRICFVLYDFAIFYFFGIPLPLGLLSVIFVSVWIVRRMTVKG